MLGCFDRRSGPLVGCLAAGLGLALTACGTNVPELMKRDGNLFWEANFLLEEAAEADVDVDPALYQAEAEKITACSFLTDEVTEQVYEGEPGFIEEVLMGAGDLLVRVVPVTQVEDCAAAVDAYGSELERLRHRLGPRMTAEEHAQ